MRFRLHSLRRFGARLAIGLAVAVGSVHAGGVRPWAWGNNEYGQLGDGTTTERHTPVQTASVTYIRALTGGWRHTVALRTDETVWTCGWNARGQLGDGTTDDSETPVQVGALTNVRAVAAGDKHCLALLWDGTVWGWGANDSHQIVAAGASEYTAPVRVPGLSDVKAVAAGWTHGVAVKTDGSVWTWGNNTKGQLGIGETGGGPWGATQVVNLANVQTVAGGWYHSVALKTDGTVWAWGYNVHGQVGDDTTEDRNTPVQVSNLTNVQAIAAGKCHTLALKSDGTVWAWGDNGRGQLGDATNAERHTPVQVSGLTHVQAISAKHDHSVALKTDGTVWAWGYNLYGQLGDNTTTHRNAPVQVSSLTGVRVIGAGYYHTLATQDSPNDPHANDDTPTVAMETRDSVLDVLSNDHDPNGDPLTITDVTDPPHGTATGVQTHVLYTPDPGYEGQDSFQYTISDGQAQDSATVTVTVTGHVAWTYTLQVLKEDGNPWHQDGWVIGMRENATDDYDLGLDSLTVPPKPDGTSVWFRIGAGIAAQEKLQTDIRKSKRPDGWKLVIKVAPQKTWKLTWAAGQFPSGMPMPAAIQEADADWDGIGPAIDMSTTGEASLVNNTSDLATKRWMIRLGPEFVDLDLARGWNLVSLPITPDDTSRVSVFPGCTVYAYNAATGSYYTPSEIEAKLGCWVYTDIARRSCICGTAPADSSAALIAGWNLVGPTGIEALPGLPVVTICGYNAETGSYHTPSKCKPRCAYWMYATAATTIWR